MERLKYNNRNEESYMTFKEKYENANTIPIVNNIKYNDWLSSKMHTDKKNFDEFMLLTRKNVKTFKRLFAEQHGCYTTWYRSWIWIINFKGYDFYLCTSKRGTTIELSYDGSYEEFRDDEEVGNYCIEFVMDLIEDIKINEPDYIPTSNHIHMNEEEEKELINRKRMIEKYLCDEKERITEYHGNGIILYVSYLKTVLVNICWKISNMF